MMDMEPEAGLVGELLQLDLPQPDTRSIRAAAIGRDRQFAGFRVALAPHRVEPAADGGDGELSRVARDPDAHPPGIGANVVDAIRGARTKRKIKHGKGIRLTSHMGGCRPGISTVTHTPGRLLGTTWFLDADAFVQ
jgi:ribosomal protein S18 acetylase RimI-like enzyme